MSLIHIFNFATLLSVEGGAIMGTKILLMEEILHQVNW